MLCQAETYSVPSQFSRWMEDYVELQPQDMIEGFPKAHWKQVLENLEAMPSPPTYDVNVFNQQWWEACQAQAEQEEREEQEHPFWLKGFAKFSAHPPQTLNFILVSFVKGAGACRSQCVLGQVGTFQFVQPHDCSDGRHSAGSAWIPEQVDQVMRIQPHGRPG